MVAHGVVIGRNHRLLQQNCQDMAVSGRNEAGDCFFGLVADGCGSKYAEPGGENGRRQVIPSHNEVGAKLLVQFAGGWLGERMGTQGNSGELRGTRGNSGELGGTRGNSGELGGTRGNSEELRGSPELLLLLDELGVACCGFLEGLLALLPGSQSEGGRARLVATHLLATLVGFVVTPEAAAFFWAGDGYLVQNGQVTRLDEGNRPRYLAYGLLGQEANGLQVRLLPDRQAIKWLAVATDGWQEASLVELAAPRSGLEVQRWLNVQAKQRGRFEDDGAVAVWYGGE